MAVGGSRTSNADPRSTISACPMDRCSMILAGLMSPCTMPSRCSEARPTRQSRMMATATPGSSREFRAVRHQDLFDVTRLGDRRIPPHVLVDLRTQQASQIVAVYQVHGHQADALVLPEPLDPHDV